MPRANRYILPGCSYHVTHRCHNRSFLLRFAMDRNEYRERLRQAKKEFNVSLLGYCITSNHTHLLVNAETTEALSDMMQKLEGEFAEYYNHRKKRSGAFWDGRYNCTMIDSGQYLWNCMKYVDLNMIRAGAVAHPADWRWCGYHELIGKRQRYKLLNFDRVLELHDGADKEEFRANYEQVIGEAVESRELSRESMWTESIAVGSELFVKSVEKSTRNRVRVELYSGPAGEWAVREAKAAYG